ncbi:MAG: serine hydrolase [Pirellulaceae bacterium]
MSIRVTLTNVFLAGTLWFATSVSAVADDATANISAAAGYDELATTISAIVQREMEDKKINALSIALVDGSQTVWAQGFGWQDARKEQPATAQTVFRVGSVSKLFTDVALMQWFEQGKVDLDRPVSDILTGFHPRTRFEAPITLRQLMAHRAGIVREPPLGHYFDDSSPTLATTVASLNESDAVFEPASRTKYSNAGVSVVGLVVEQLAGKPFADAVDESILQPLGMSSSGFVLRDGWVERIADAEMWTYDGRSFPAPTFTLGTLPAGNLYSSVIDLAEFAKAICGSATKNQASLLRSETWELMMTPQFEQQYKGFGLGFHLSELDVLPAVGHGGAVYGFSTQFLVLPEQQLAVVVATSRDLSNGIAKRIAEHTMRSLLTQKNVAGVKFPAWETSTEIPPLRARQLDGLYRDESTHKEFELRERNGELFLLGEELERRLGWQQDHLVCDDCFGFGPELYLDVNQSIRRNDKQYSRVDRRLPSPLPERYQGLVGEYGWDHNTLYVYERGGQLHCLIEWFFHYPLTEVGEGVFAFPDYGLYEGEQLRFGPTNNGNARYVRAASVQFDRRTLGAEDGSTFRIAPTASIDELRRDALAARPAESLTHSELASDLVELVRLDGTIHFDIRYATQNNFMGVEFYDQPRAFLQRPAAEAVVRAHRKLNQLGYGLLIHDAYRPWYVTKMFWDATPAEQKIFVANPATGSRHNRGCAIDLTLFDLNTGKAVDMGAGYDEFSPRAFPDYPVAHSRARYHRELLRDAMEAEGFTIYEHEWWHFDYGQWRKYPVMNTPFESLR